MATDDNTDGEGDNTEAYQAELEEMFSGGDDADEASDTAPADEAEHSPPTEETSSRGDASIADAEVGGAAKAPPDPQQGDGGGTAKSTSQTGSSRAGEGSDGASVPKPPQSGPEDTYSPDSTPTNTTGNAQQHSQPDTASGVERSDGSVTTRSFDLDWATVKGSISRAGRWSGRFIARKFWGRSDPQTGLSGLYYPDGAINTEGEEIVFAVTPSRWRSAGPYTIVSILVATAILAPLLIYYGGVIGFLNSRTPSFITVTAPSWSLMWKFSAVLLLLGGLLVFIESLRRASRWLVLTNEKIVYRNRILDKNVTELSLDDINKTEVEMEFPQRLVDIGVVKLYTAATSSIDEAELEFYHLKWPSDRRDDIARELKRDESSQETN